MKEGISNVMKHIFNTPAAKITLGLLIGAGLLYAVLRVVDVRGTINLLQQNLATPRGILLALLAGCAFLLAFSVRGIRWKLFLNSIDSSISTFVTIRLFLIGIFINFLLPISSGELVKALLLKRLTSIPVSRSLPTVAMDRSLDLLPAFFLMAIVPLLGIKMDAKLWVALDVVGGLLFVLALFVVLVARKRTAAIKILCWMARVLPMTLRNKITYFAIGFVDSLLMAVSRPKVFVPAVLLTCVAVTLDSTFAMLAFWAIGFQISFGTVLLGYTTYNMFYIFPTPPGQIGSNEAIGLLVFTGLLHIPSTKVTAMFIFSHPWAGLLICVTGFICLKSLGVTIPSVLKRRSKNDDDVTLLEKEDVSVLL
jgi:uncharacterized protein (TIRG00374 family)